MRSINFLPAEYREKRRSRRAQVWRSVSLIALGGLLTCVTLAQLAIYRSLKGQAAEFESVAVDAMIQEQTLAILNQELEQQRTMAELCAYLQHPWPRTQIVNQILGCLPETATITEFRLVREVPVATSGPFARPNAAPPSINPPANGAATQESPVQADLRRLREEYDSKVFVVSLEGTTRDDADLHRYVGELQRTPLFSHAEIVSLESVRESGNRPTTRYRLRVVVRPGIGQPGGPARSLSVQTARAVRHEVSP